MNNEVRVRCTKDGISVEGARDIGSTSDTKAGSLSQFLRIAECWWFTYCEKSPGQEADCYGNAGAARHKCPTALLSLDEAIAHAEDCADDTPCGRNHRQLADWLKELRSLRHCNAAAAKREKRLLKSCARWILTHDIYGNMAKELLAECKEVLHDDGRFLLSEEGAENGKV